MSSDELVFKEQKGEAGIFGFALIYIQNSKMGWAVVQLAAAVQVTWIDGHAEQMRVGESLT